MKYVIIGASIAGTTAAETIRSLDPTGEIFLVTEEAYPLYSRITIAAAVSGKVLKENLILRKTEQYLQKRIILYLGLTARHIDRDARIVSFADKDGAVTTLTYDKLLIATGGKPNKLHVPGSQGNGIFSMHNLDDASLIHNYAKGKTKAVIAGGSFIGIDFLTSFLELGLDIDYLIRDEGFLSRLLSPTAQQFIHKIFERKGIHIHTNTEIMEFDLDIHAKVKGVKTNTGEYFPCQIVGLGIGINRITPFIQQTGLPTQTGLLTNEYLQTTDAQIFAAGDIAEHYDARTGQYLTNGDWLSARLEGEVAGKNMAGTPIPYEELVTNTSNIFGTNLTVIGQIDQHGTQYERESETAYIQVFTKDDIVIGGITIGDNEYSNRLKAAIKEKRKATSIDI